MSLPTDLPREIGDRVQPPGFDEVLARAEQGRRRRRTTIASGLAAGVVVAGVAFAATGPLTPERSAPEPATPGPTEQWDGSSDIDPRLPGAVQDLLREDRVDPVSVSASGDGIAVVWRSCTQTSCAFAVVTRHGDDVTGTASTAPTLTPVPGGWFVDGGGYTVSQLTPTGEQQPLVVTGPGDGDVMAGDAFLQPQQHGSVLLRGSKLVPAPTAPGSRGIHNGYVTPEGRLVAAVLSGDGSGLSLTSTDDGRTWEDPTTTRSDGSTDTAAIAGSGDHVAVAVLGDDPDGSIPLREVLVSHDAGRTWSRVEGLDLEGGDRVRDLSSVAVSSAGTTYLATASHHIVRIDADGDAVPTQLSAFDSSVVASGDTVCVVAESGAIDRLECSEDDGRSWTSQPLPGFR